MNKKSIFQCDFRSDLITFYESYNYKKDYLGIVPKLHCQGCNKEIPYDEKYVKDNLLYVTSDWTKCLCSRCTAAWKRRKEIAETYPNFGKRVELKMFIIDDLKKTKDAIIASSDTVYTSSTSDN